MEQEIRGNRNNEREKRPKYWRKARQIDPTKLAELCTPCRSTEYCQLEGLPSCPKIKAQLQN